MLSLHHRRPLDWSGMTHSLGTHSCHLLLWLFINELLPIKAWYNADIHSYMKYRNSVTLKITLICMLAYIYYHYSVVVIQESEYCISVEIDTDLYLCRDLLGNGQMSSNKHFWAIIITQIEIKALFY